MGLEALNLDQFKEFNSKEADILYRQVRADLSKERPDGKAYLWIKKNKPKIFARAIGFETAWAAAVEAFDMTAVQEALNGMKGVWLYGYGEYRQANGK